MSTLVSVCIVLIAVAVWLQTLAVVAAAIQLRRAARAVEARVYEVGDGIERVKEVVAAASDIARSPLIKGLGLALGAVSTYIGVRSRRRTAPSATNGRSRE